MDNCSAEENIRKTRVEQITFTRVDIALAFAATRLGLPIYIYIYFVFCFLLDESPKVHLVGHQQGWFCLPTDNAYLLP